MPPKASNLSWSVGRQCFKESSQRCGAKPYASEYATSHNLKTIPRTLRNPPSRPVQCTPDATSCPYVPLNRRQLSRMKNCSSNGKRGRWPKRVCLNAESVRAMPGHDTSSRIGAGEDGGARGCCQRSNASITTICPPQQGHGGRTSTSSIASVSSGGGATSSNWRASAMLVLRADAASKP